MADLAALYSAFDSDPAHIVAFLRATGGRPFGGSPQILREPQEMVVSEGPVQRRRSG